jgi:hypothetical protein
VECDSAWVFRFRRLVKDYERLPETVAGLHFVAFACLMLHRAITTLGAGLKCVLATEHDRPSVGVR